MKYLFAAFFSIVIVLIAVSATLADGPKIKAGKWEFTTTSHNPMMPEPKVITETKCITEEEAGKDPLAAMVEESECEVLSREESGDTIEFEMECTGEMGISMKGKGKFTGDGSTASGHVEMTLTMPQMSDKPIKMTQEWKGKRIGDCD